MKSRIYQVLVWLALASLLLSGCGQAISPTPTAVPTAVAIKATLPPKPAATVAPTAVRQAGELLLATTTSTADSGLLEYILPDFEKANNLKVKVVAVGTGQAMELGRRGDADVLLVHDPAQEDKFMAEGYGTTRYDVMYNDFIILGAANDPAGVKGTPSATEAFKKIAASKSAFISRGDNSGTHGKEKTIWQGAAIDPKGEWYISAGQGMGEVLNMANERQAYTLSDRATYLSRKGNLKLVVLVEGDKTLFNPYSVILVNPQKYSRVQYELAQKFADWLTSVETQKKIATYQIGGQNLFFPDSEAWRKAGH